MRRTITASLVLVMFGQADAAAVACHRAGPDDVAIERVQASWDDGQKALEAGRYAASIRLMKSTLVYLPGIKDAFIRRCVDGGAQVRIFSARAGEAALEAHPSDVRGAKAAADRAWRAYPQRHDCP